MELACPFIELDRLVEQDYGARIPDLIEMAGLATFRRYERACLERVIDEHDAAVIATAGGIVSNAETYALLLRRTHTVWIKARPDEHMSRVMEQGDFRPMAQNREAMADLVAILDARRADYARAQAELDTSGDTVERSFEKLARAPGDASVFGRRWMPGPSPGMAAYASKRKQRTTMTKLADQGFLQLGADAARIPHDRPAAGRGADARAAARGARLAPPSGAVSRTSLPPPPGPGVFAYSRAGYGQSSPSQLPRPVSFMHDEAREVLPRVLDAMGFRRGLLVGHSDGASIAAIYAGSVQDHRVRGLALMAPHFFTEDMGIAEIARAKMAFETGPLAGQACAHACRPRQRILQLVRPLARSRLPQLGAHAMRSPISACRS